MWFWLAIVSIIFVLAKIERNRQKLSKRFKHIPGPKEYPFIGNILSIKINDVSDFENIVDSVCVAPVSKITLGGSLVLVVYDPTQVQRILGGKEFLEKPFYFDFFNLKYGLFSAKYSIWKPIRKATNASLNHASVINMIPIFNKHLERLCTNIGRHLNQGVFNIEDCLVKFGIEQVFETMVGHEYTCSEVVKNAFQETGFAVTERGLNPLFHPNFIYRFTSLCKRVTNSYDILKNMFEPIVERRKKVLEFGSDKRFFIDELLKMEKDEIVEENFISIILAGYETTALTMAYTILMLAMHPEVDKVLYKEITDYYKNGDELNYDTVKRMPYLDMVVKEVLRLFPAVPGTMRETLFDTNIENIGLIPKGTIIAVPTFKMHRDPEIWGADAVKFNPDHFLPQNVAERHPYSYIPFSAGSRNCIGMYYANVNVRMGLVKILSQYRFTTQMKYEDLHYKVGITLRLTSPHSVEVHKR